MEKILQLAMKKAQAAEVIRVDHHSTPVEFKAGRLSSVSDRHTTGWGLRVIHEGRLGFSSTTDVSRRDSLVENALLSARFGQRAAFEFPNAVPHTVDTFDQALANLTAKELIARGTEALATIKEQYPRVHTEATLSKAVSSLRVLNSAGLDVSCRKTNLACELTSLLVKDGLLWVTEAWHGGKLVWEMDRMVKRLLNKLSLAQTTCQVPTARSAVIFAPEALPNLLMGVEMGINGKNVQKGSSPLCDRLGEELMDSRITLIDDATLPLGVASYPFDGEGVPARRNVLIQDGVLRGYLYDLQTAGLMKTTSTGSAQRGFDSQPSPGSSNLVLEPGEKTIQEMARDIGRGLIVYRVLGGGQSNLLAGDFSLNADLAFGIENGESSGRVKDTMISGNIYEAGKRIVAIASERRQVGSDLLPAIAFSDLQVSSNA